VSAWRPSPGEERWLETAARLRGALLEDLATERTGGWRSAGLFARIALFVLGLVAAALTLAVLGFDHDAMLLVAGLVAAGAAEWLKVGKRLHASGIEEGLCVGGYLMIGVWIAGRIAALPDNADLDDLLLCVGVAIGAAAFRLLNPFLATCAALAFIERLDSAQVARTIDAAAGGGTAALAFACVVAAAALAAGAREFRRLSHDRMLDWIVVALPLYAYARHVSWSWVAMVSGSPPGTAGLVVTVALLAGFGALALVAGLRRRRHAPLLAFLGCVACIAVEMRLVIHWTPETRLVLDGLAAIAVGLAIDHYLRRPRSGLTSARLTDREGPLDLLQAVGAAVLAQPGRSGEPATSEPAVAARDGRFGGGGASASY
jgi:hypothetical protein